MDRPSARRRAIIPAMTMPGDFSVEHTGSSSTAAPLEEHIALLDGHAIHYLSAGAGKGAIAFLSGWGCDTSLWRHQVPALAPHARLLLVDLPGHGRSDKPDIPYTIALFARAVDAVLEDAHVERAAIAGHSMGAMVAYQFAREHPDKATAIIFVEGAFGIPVEVEKQIAGFRSRAQELRSADYQEKLLAFVDQLFIPETPAAVREEVRQSILATPQHVLASSTENFAVPELFAPDVLDVPAFAVFCAFWHPERFVDIFKKYLPRLEYEVLEGSGHYPMLEKPDETNAALLRVMGKIQQQLH
jgi:pimeloyl-ACP methyl ester carboxylesterase